VPRQNVFVGTTNDDTPFQDPTGNRRFWPVACGVIDLAGIKRDRDQLWAEAVAAYRAGLPWWPDTVELNELATAEQAARRERDAWEPKILDWIENPIQRRITDGMGTRLVEPWYGSRSGKVSLQDILLHCLEKTIDRLTPMDGTRVTRVLKANGWRRVQEGAGIWRGKWYYTRDEETA